MILDLAVLEFYVGFDVFWTEDSRLWMMVPPRTVRVASLVKGYDFMPKDGSK